MRMNDYMWKLYLQAGGHKTVSRFKSFECGQTKGFSKYVCSLVSAYCPDPFLLKDVSIAIDHAVHALEMLEEGGPFVQTDALDDYRIDELPTYSDIAEEMWEALQEEYPECHTQKEIFEVFSNNLVQFSVLDYYDNPRSYIPYFFPCLYNVLATIAELFEIGLPSLPRKQDYKGRAAHYYALCSSFTAFREENGWSSAELCAFLYDFAPKFSGGKNWLWHELPEPRSAFVVGSGSNIDAQFQSLSGEGAICCQGSPDTQPGDMILLYQWAPISSIRSIWRAKSSGFIDPLFLNYRCIYIGQLMNTPSVSFKELKADPLLGQTALIKTNMLGMNGTELKPSEYICLIEMLKRKGFDVSQLPTLDDRLETLLLDHHIETEHDVEIMLLEPLLEKLGWTRENYVRQMPLRMGRGSFVYPDYVIMPQFTPGREKGLWIVEAKRSISTAKQLAIDWGQAASYAQRLCSVGFMLVAQEGVWLAERSNDFQNKVYYKWAQLQSPDVFSQLYAIVGNRRRRPCTIESTTQEG